MPVPLHTAALSRKSNSKTEAPSQPVLHITLFPTSANMASRSIWQRALILIIALISPVAYAQLGWLVHDPFSGGGGPEFNPRSCVWVATQAFVGWGSRTVTVTAHNYIRWGQTSCVLQIANTSPTSFSVQGGWL